MKIKNHLLSTALGALALGVLAPAESQALLMVQQWRGAGNSGLAGVDNAIATRAADHTSFWSVIDFTDDPAGFAGNIPGSNPWPLAAANGASGTSNPYNDNFAARISGFLTITVADTYRFQTYADDGVRLRIGGTDVIVDNGYHPEQQRLGSIFLTAGTYALDLVFFEGGGEASLEFTVAQGQTGAFGHLNSLNGVTTSTASVPDAGSSAALLGLGVAGLAWFSRRRPTA